MSDHPFQHPDPDREPHEPLGGTGFGAEDFLGLGATPEAPQAFAEEPAYEPVDELRAAAVDTEDQADWSAPAPEPEWDLGAEEDEDETMSWLMELEGREGAEEFDPFTALDESGADAPLLVAPAGGGWLLRVAIAGVSLGLGFVGARFLAGREAAPTTPPPTVAQAPASTPQGPAATPDSAQTPTTPEPEALAQAPQQEPAPIEPASPPTLEPVAEAPAPVELDPEPTPTIEGVGRPPVVAESTPAPTPVVETPTTVAAAEPARELPDVGRNPRARFTGPGRNPYLSLPAPFLTLDGHGAGGASEEAGASAAPGGPTVTVVHGAAAPSIGLGGGEEVVTRVVRGPGSELTQDDLADGMREASAADLAGLWVGGTIPMERIDGEARLMTPGVGRVRVLLLGGEVFEGELYAVGERKVWIQSETGRLALMSWQIERVEHLVGSAAPSAPSGDGVQVANVRVRTATGVFYGQLIDREGRNVTLMTTTGARITLQDAEIDSAGRSATHIVDAAGLKAAEDQQP